MKRFVTCALLLALSGCVTDLGRFTIISTKNIDLSRLSTFKQDDDRVHGRDLDHIILWFPTSLITVQAAIDNALEHVPGAVALIDVKVTKTFWWVFYYGQEYYEISGTALVDPSLVSTESGPRYYVATWKDGKTNVQRVDKETFEAYQ